METLFHIGLSNAVAATVLALVVVLLALVTRRPALVHGLWLLVLLKLITPPFLPLNVSWNSESTAPSYEAQEVPCAEPIFVPDLQLILEAIATGAEDEHVPIPVLPLEHENVTPDAEGEREGTVTSSLPWRLGLFNALLSIWLVGTGGWYILALFRLTRFARMLRRARPASVEMIERIERLARKLGLKRLPGICLVPGPIAPLIWAVGNRTRLVLPAELFERVATDQQDTLILHELAHLLRGDHWVRLLEFFVRGVYWWHPVVWYACRELRELEEQCCDAWVVSTLPGSGRTYATALVETLDFLSESRPATPLLASGIGHVNDLKRRLQMIMCATTPRSLTWGGLLAVLVLGGFVLPLWPTWGQDKTIVPTPKTSASSAQPSKKSPEDLSKAEGELKKLQDELARKHDEMREMEKRLAEAAAKVQAQKAQTAEQAARVEKQRIEIHWAKDDRLIDRAKSSTTGRPREIILREVDGKWIVVNPAEVRGGGMGGAPGMPGGSNNYLARPALPGPLNVPQPPTNPFAPKGPQHAPEGDKRIENLERKIESLEKTINELIKHQSRTPGIEPKKP